jgi:diguanylate cyclase (GGDEF)-like protein
MAQQKLLIIAVSKDFELIENLSSSLKKKYEFRYFKNYETALEIIGKTHPALIIAETDIDDLNGFDFYRILRKGQKTKHTPFIFISNNDDTEKRIDAIQFGADAYLNRPINMEELKAHISTKASAFSELYNLSITDELTNLYNRREFVKLFSSETEKNPAVIISLAIIDLDFFKQVNDIHGHQTGDTVLMEFAALLKKHSRKDIFPVRFGGEEFIMIFINHDAHIAKTLIDKIREHIHSKSFKSPIGRNFHISFSAGIAEYPSIGKNLSLLLSKADQALYTAKKDGRGRSYIFSPAMIRNDRFWEFLKKRKGLFHEKNGYDPSTSLPFLSYALESIISEESLNYIGVIVMRFFSFMKIKEELGITTFDFCFENIREIVKKTCEQHFASDTLITISDSVDKEITILFPLFINIPLNEHKCNNLYKEIIEDINIKILNYPFFMSYSGGVIEINDNNPRSILHDIKTMRMRSTTVGKKRDIYYFLKDSFAKALKYDLDNIQKLVRIDNYRNIDDNEVMAFSIIPANESFSFIPIYHFLIESSHTVDLLKLFFSKISPLLKENSNLPFFIPYIPVCGLSEYIPIISEYFGSYRTVIFLNETFIDISSSDLIDEVSQSLPKNMSFGIDNCSINKAVINIIAKVNISHVILSEYLTRDIHLFKDRIKIVNGFNVYLEQIGIPLAAKNIHKEDEYQIMFDLNISMFSGYYRV